MLLSEPLRIIPEPEPIIPGVAIRVVHEFPEIEYLKKLVESIPAKTKMSLSDPFLIIELPEPIIPGILEELTRFDDQVFAVAVEATLSPTLALAPVPDMAVFVNVFPERLNPVFEVPSSVWVMDPFVAESVIEESVEEGFDAAGFVIEMFASFEA